VETLHPAEIKHAPDVRSFHVMRSFHANRERRRTGGRLSRSQALGWPAREPVMVDRYAHWGTPNDPLSCGRESGPWPFKERALGFNHLGPLRVGHIVANRVIGTTVSGLTWVGSAGPSIRGRIRRLGLGPRRRTRSRGCSRRSPVAGLPCRWSRRWRRVGERRSGRRRTGS